MGRGRNPCGSKTCSRPILWCGWPTANACVHAAGSRRSPGACGAGGSPALSTTTTTSSPSGSRPGLAYLRRTRCAPGGSSRRREPVRALRGPVRGPLRPGGQSWPARTRAGHYLTHCPALACHSARHLSVAGGRALFRPPGQAPLPWSERLLRRYGPCGVDAAYLEPGGAAGAPAAGRMVRDPWGARPPQAGAVDALSPPSPSLALALGGRGRLDTEARWAAGRGGSEEPCPGDTGRHPRHPGIVPVLTAPETKGLVSGSTGTENDAPWGAPHRRPLRLGVSSHSRSGRSRSRRRHFSEGAWSPDEAASAAEAPHPKRHRTTVPP